MKQEIDQFIWPFQQQFRRSVEYETERALEGIGFHTKPRALLVGFAQDEAVRHQVCVEPEDGPLKVQHLAEVRARADEIFDADPESQILHSHPRLRMERYLALRRRSRASALVEAIEQSQTFPGLRFFAGGSTPIDGYEVHTCVGVHSSSLDAFPAFEDSVSNRIYVGRSLQHEVIEECLRRADRALYLPDPGLFALGAAEDIVRSAADTFVRGTVGRATGMHSDLFGALNICSTLSYERSKAGGRLVVADPRSADIHMSAQFQQPISLHDSRTMRKLLEVSDEANSVLANEREAYGVGTCVPGPQIVEISVRDHAEWELSVDGCCYLRVSYGRALLPRPSLDLDKFTDIAERTVGPFARDKIAQIVSAAQDSAHGMTLVISSDPEHETDRLGGEAMPIAPAHLAPDLIARLSRVDGAVVLGPDGRCHAFGVILDGTSAGRGDRGRGSRFNSAVRYQKTQKQTGNESVLVVVSVDGSVDIVPALRPMVNKREVEAAVRDFCATCESEHVDGEEFGRTFRRVEEFEFYLNEDQCQRVNDCHDNEMRRRVEEGGISATRRPFRPAADMDDSYFS